MSFWDLANGRESDLIPPVDIDPSLSTIKGTAASATVGLLTGVGALLAGNPAQLARVAYNGAKGIHQANSEAESERAAIVAQNEANVRLRKELGLLFLRRVAETQEPTSELYCRLARSLYGLGKSQEALEMVEQARTLNPKCIESPLLYSFLLFEVGRDADAIAAFHVADECSLSPNLLLGLIESLWKRNLIYETIRALEWLIRIAPEDASAHARLANLYDRHGRVPEAVRHFEIANELSPSEKLPWKIALSKAQENMRVASHREAFQLCDRALRYKPQWLEPALFKASALMAMHQFQEAIELLRELIADYPMHANLHFLLGRAYAAIGEMGNAHSCWVSAFEIDPGVPVPWVEALSAAERSTKAKQYQVAYGHVLEALRLLPTWGRALELQRRLDGLIEAERLRAEAEQAHEAGRQQAARECYAASLDLAEDADVLLKLGAIEADRGNLYVALRHFERASALGHLRATMAIQLCQAYLELLPEVGPRA